MKLFPMTDSEYAMWVSRSEVEYAEDKMKAEGLTREEAEKVASESFARLLPDGLASKDNYLFTAKGEGREVLGFIWFGIQGAGANRRAFIYDVVIEEAYRGKGFGKRMMLLLEDEIRKVGLKRVGLHVFGFNKVAIGLYQSLGYGTTDLVMEKGL